MKRKQSDLESGDREQPQSWVNYFIKKHSSTSYVGIGQD